MEKVSIVIPVYNGENYLVECLDSVINQSYRELEIIVSIDSSTDRSKEIIGRYLHDSRIQLIENSISNRGIFGNLNNALKHVSGTYIQIFCQDDVMYPNMIEEQLQSFSKYPDVGMVYCAKDAIDSKGEKMYLPAKPWVIPDIISPPDSFNYLFSFGCLPGNLSTVMLHANCLLRAGYFDTKYIYAGDFEYWVRIAKFYNIVSNKKNLVAVRQHSQRGSKTLNVKFVLLEEEVVIYNTLLHAAFSTQQARKAANYIARIRGIQHFHMLVKSVLSGRILASMKVLKKFKYPFSLYKVVFYYFFTLNLRVNYKYKLIEKE